jgi:HEAT repeat protein
MRTATLLALLGALGCLAPAQIVTAQIVLPGNRPAPAQPKGNLAAATYCGTCGWKNTLYAPTGKTDEAGRAYAYCEPCRRDTPQVGSAQESGPGLNKSKRESDGGNLVVGRRPKAAAEPVAPAAPVAATPAPVGTPPQGGTETATQVVARVRLIKKVDDPAVGKAVEELVTAGEAGRLLARSTLLDTHAPLVVVSARTLLVAPKDNDADLVVERLRGDVPLAAAPLLLEALIERDPVRASPRLLCDMLDHASGGVRTVARRELSKMLDTLDLSLLERPLASKRADTRAEVVTILSQSSAPAASAMLLRVVDDGSARTAQAAQRALAVREDATLDAQLVQAALGARWILRQQACALLAIVEREDLGPRTILDARHVDPLLNALSSADHFLAGTAATALAGIGFRSSDAKMSEWLDGLVVDRLVHAAATREFQPDLAMLQPAALRRLESLTGRRYGNNSAAWLEWWVEARPRFHARRANLEIDIAEAGGLKLLFEDTNAPDGAVTLVGPELAADAEQAGARGEIVYLNEAECRAVVESLRAAGVLATATLPGVRGSRGRGERHLEIEVRGRTKGFTLGPNISEPWFEATAAMVRTMQDAQRWQRLVPREARARRLEWVKAEQEWWQRESDEAKRRARRVELALACIDGAAPAVRELALTEIERDCAAGAQLGASEFPRLVAWMGSETAALDRAKRTALLALAAARHAGGGKAPPEMAQQLVAVAIARFGADSETLIADVLDAAGHATARAAAMDGNPLLRRAAARALSSHPSEEDVAALRTLLSDKDRSVEATAVRALGENKVEAARTELLVRARLGFPEVRAAALEAVGSMGGEFVLDALVLGATDADVQVRRASAKGLANLADPSATGFLVGLLGDGSDEEVRAAAREGVLKLGGRAVPELTRLLHQPGGRMRRDAALLLARLGSPDAVSPLLAILTQRRADAQVAEELAVLTCFDPRAQPEAVEAWWQWWEGVRHDDSLLWFRAGLERVGISTPPQGALEGEGTLQGRIFLTEVLARPEDLLVERARRELGRLLGREIGPLPPKGREREEYARKLREELRSTR